MRHPQWLYHLVVTNSLPWKIAMLLIGKPSINGPFSMAMLNNQMEYGHNVGENKLGKTGSATK